MTKTGTKANTIDLAHLVNAIDHANQLFRDQTQRQVNRALTMRNWMIGFYIAEYEQQGLDRAAYGEQLFRQLAKQLKTTGIKGLSFTVLHLCKQFYLTYPQIRQSLPDESKLNDFQSDAIVQAVTEQLDPKISTTSDQLLNKLSFTHIVELIKVDSPIKRAFYETETIRNNWSVRELQRAMNSLLFERTGLSTDKQAVLEKHRSGSGLKPEDIFRSPYLLDFLGP